jgi:hypothetical protein
MLTMIARCKLDLAGPLRMGDDNGTGGGDSQLSKRLGDYTFHLVCVGTVALIATSIRVWAGMSVIETRISQLVESDNQQDSRIEQVRSEVNNLRVQMGIIRAIQGASGLGRP